MENKKVPPPPEKPDASNPAASSVGAVADLPGLAAMRQRQPRASNYHDILIIPHGTTALQRIEVAKVDGAALPVGEGPLVPKRAGQYYGAAEPGPLETGHRKAMTIATSGGGDPPRGPAFAALPIKPEPASSHWTCYLINGNNVNFKNSWTHAEWNEEPGVADQQEGTWDAPKFELLIAGPRGRVFHLRVEDQWHDLREVDLAYEGEVWSELRSGMVAGTVLYFRHPDAANKRVPMVNVTAINKKEG